MPSMEEKELGEGLSEPVLIQKIPAVEKDLVHDLIRPMNEELFCWPVRLYATRMMPRRTCKQVMVKIFQRLAQLKDSDRFKQWAMRVVENEAKMYRRKRRQLLYESIDQSATEVSEEKP